jgi:DNA repair exonuclease SbcCD ATPase subunit
MKPKITPFLQKEIPSLHWKINPTKTALENLQEALEELQKQKKSLEKNPHTTPNEPRTHIQNLEKLEQALEESQITLASLDLLQLVLKKKKFQSENKKIEELPFNNLNQILLNLYAKTPAIRRGSENFPGAELEIQADHAAMLSLYQTEFHKRNPTTP